MAADPYACNIRCSMPHPFPARKEPANSLLVVFALLVLAPIATSIFLARRAA